jgi:hypothetical protein
MAERRRYLDEEFVVPRVLLEQAQGILAQLADVHLSPLPAAMRNTLARCHRHLAVMSRALARTPEAVRAQRAREDQTPSP